MSNFKPQLSPGLTWLHVLSDSGASFGKDGTSHSVSNAMDREFLVSARRQADWILVSADTFIAEEYKPSKFAPIAVTTTSPSKREKVLARLSELETHQDRMPIEIFESVAAFKSQAQVTSSNRILLESGRTMFQGLRAAGLVAAAYVTVTNPREDAGRSSLSALSADCGLDAERFRCVSSRPELSIWRAVF